MTESEKKKDAREPPVQPFLVFLGVTFTLFVCFVSTTELLMKFPERPDRLTIPISKFDVVAVERVTELLKSFPALYATVVTFLMCIAVMWFLFAWMLLDSEQMYERKNEAEDSFLRKLKTRTKEIEELKSLLAKTNRQFEDARTEFAKRCDRMTTTAPTAFVSAAFESCKHRSVREEMTPSDTAPVAPKQRDFVFHRMSDGSYACTRE